MMSKGKWAAGIVLACSVLGATTAGAFSDLQGEDAKTVEDLQQRGVVQGVTQDKFVPQGKLSGAQALQMIAKAMRFEAAQPAGSAWYSGAVQAAKAQGVVLPEDVKLTDNLTREQFAFLLDKAISATGNYPMIKIYINVADENDITSGYQGAIQRMLVLKMTSLDESGKFYPKQAMTRMEAARMVLNASEFVEKHKATKPNEDSITYKAEKLADQKQKVVLTRSQQPNPGYGIEVAKVEYKADTAIVYYKLLSPKPGQMYPQVITDTHAEVTIPAQYKIEIAPLE